MEIFFQSWAEHAPASFNNYEFIRYSHKIIIWSRRIFEITAVRSEKVINKTNFIKVCWMNIMIISEKFAIRAHQREGRQWHKMEKFHFPTVYMTKFFLCHLEAGWYMNRLYIDTIDKRMRANIYVDISKHEQMIQIWNFKMEKTAKN